jgi:DNA (cytosine-5)-methyltransferase 1
MTAYYNENDPYAAQWLRNLIAAGHIAPGEVDERSILDVRADDLRGFRQCHFFAGIGVWSHALRLAGWPDDREVWTGSCPCQPFSSAGAGQADEDDRHLAPVWLRLISECRPSVVFGEQVGAAIRVGWLDALFTEMEQLHYACGAVDFPACSVGAPHIRQRLYFVADSEHSERWPLSRPEQDERNGDDDGRPEAHGIAGACGEVCELADSAQQQRDRSRHGRPRWRSESPDGSELGDTDNARSQGRRLSEATRGRDGAGERTTWEASIAYKTGCDLVFQREKQATTCFWSDADWLPCIDGKARPVESGTFPLAHVDPQRVGRLRAYGNAICAEQAAEFVRAYLA